MVADWMAAVTHLHTNQHHVIQLHHCIDTDNVYDPWAVFTLWTEPFDFGTRCARSILIQHLAVVAILPVFQMLPIHDFWHLCMLFFLLSYIKQSLPAVRINIYNMWGFIFSYTQQPETVSGPAIQGTQSEPKNPEMLLQLQCFCMTMGSSEQKETCSTEIWHKYMSELFR